MLDMYDTGAGVQVDTKWGCYVFSPSRLTQGNVEIREYYPQTPAVWGRAAETLALARANGLPF
jgi:hypothetical protein